jgi:hypothetical protein
MPDIAQTDVEYEHIALDEESPRERRRCGRGAISSLALLSATMLSM